MSDCERHSYLLKREDQLYCISELGPIEDHILKNYVCRDRVPYYCRLCTSKCFTSYQLDHHATHYSRHVAAAKQMSITNHREWMVASTVPYRISEVDMLKYSQESILFFLRKQSGESVPTGAAPQMPAPPKTPARCRSGTTLQHPSLEESSRTLSLVFQQPVPTFGSHNNCDSTLNPNS